MFDFEESLYPFKSAIEFFRNGYWREPAALHLVVAYVAAAVLVFLVLRQKEHSVGQKLVTLYFCLTPFNNFAFQIGGASLGDFFGILAAAYFAGDWILRLRGWKSHLISNFLVFTGIAFSVHALLIELIYPSLNEKAGLVRIALILKIFVLAFAISLFSREFNDQKSIDWFVNQIVNFAVLAISVYFLQAFMLLMGVVPYGLYLGANFIPVPSFGGVSIERGHFGKFVTPLFPLFMIALRRDKRRFAFAAFILVTLVNISASSLVYFTGYCLLAFLAFYRSFWRAKVFAVAMPLCLFMVGGLVAARDVLSAVGEKVFELGIEGQREGGRGLGVLWEYITRFPLGLSYGGSTLRTAPNLDEINGGLPAFISQLSFLAPVFIIGLVFLAYRVLKCGQVQDWSTRRILEIGVLMMFFIFFSDVLWFVPTLWAPLLLYYQIVKKAQQPSQFPAFVPS